MGNSLIFEQSSRMDVVRDLFFLYTSGRDISKYRIDLSNKNILDLLDDDSFSHDFVWDRCSRFNKVYLFLREEKYRSAFKDKHEIFDIMTVGEASRVLLLDSNLFFNYAHRSLRHNKSQITEDVSTINIITATKYGCVEFLDMMGEGAVSSAGIRHILQTLPYLWTYITVDHIENSSMNGAQWANLLKTCILTYEQNNNSLEIIPYINISSEVAEYLHGRILIDMMKGRKKLSRHDSINFGHLRKYTNETA